MKQLIILFAVILMFSCESRKVKEVKETINSVSELVESSSMDSWKSKALAYVNTEYSKGYVTDKERDLYIKTINKEYENEFQFDYKKYLDSYTASGSPSDEIAEAFNFARKKYPNATKEILPGLVWLKLNNCLSELNSLSVSYVPYILGEDSIDKWLPEKYYDGYYIIHEGKYFDLKLKEIIDKILTKDQADQIVRNLVSSFEYIKASHVKEFKDFIRWGTNFVLVDDSGKAIEYWERPHINSTETPMSNNWRKRNTPLKVQIERKFKAKYIEPKEIITNIWSSSLGEELYGASVE